MQHRARAATMTWPDPAERRLKPRVQGLWLVFSLLIGLTSAPALAGAEAADPPGPYPPVAAGHTSIAFSGSAGITLELHETTQITDGVMAIELTSGTFAMAAVERPGCDKTDPVFADCIYFKLRHFPEYPWSSSTLLGTTPPTVDPGTYHVYVLTDGSGVLTFDFPGMSGSRSLNARGTIDGVLERFSPSCPDFELLYPECRNFGHGGGAHEVGSPDNPGMVMALSYAWIPRWDPAPGVPSNNGEVSARACVSPNSLNDPTGSPDPADHPRGCALMPTDPDWNGQTGFLAFLTPGLTSNLSGIITGFTWDAAVGEVYAGFWAKQRSNGEIQGLDGGYAGFGMWLTPGIACDEACQIATYPEGSEQ